MPPRYSTKTHRMEEITLDVNGVRYEGDWSAIPLEGVISLDIVYTSPPVMTVEEDMEDDSLPGFSMVFGFGIYITGNGCNSKEII